MADLSVYMTSNGCREMRRESVASSVTTGSILPTGIPPNHLRCTCDKRLARPRPMGRGIDFHELDPSYKAERPILLLRAAPVEKFSPLQNIAASSAIWRDSSRDRSLRVFCCFCPASNSYPTSRISGPGSALQIISIARVWYKRISALLSSWSLDQPDK